MKTSSETPQQSNSLLNFSNRKVSVCQCLTDFQKLFLSDNNRKAEILLTGPLGFNPMLPNVAGWYRSRRSLENKLL